MKTKDMTLIAVTASIICVLGPLTVQAGPVPLSLATFGVYLSGAILGKKRGTAAVALYLLIGMAGIPVFSGFGAGFQKLAGVTGGYLVGYLPCAFLTGLGALRQEKHFAVLPAMMTAGTAVLYLIGTLWFMAQTGNGLGSALSLCVVPFLPGDAMKIAAASLISVPVKKTLRIAKI